MFPLCRMSFHWPQWLSLCYFSQIQSEQAIFYYKSTTAIPDLSHQAVCINSDLRDMKYMFLCCYSLQPKLVCTREGHRLHIPKLFTLSKYLGWKINKAPTWEERGMRLLQVRVFAYSAALKILRMCPIKPSVESMVWDTEQDVKRALCAHISEFKT